MSIVHSWDIKAPFTRERSHVEPHEDRTDRPRVYTGTDGIVPYRTASGTRTGPINQSQTLFTVGYLQ